MSGLVGLVKNCEERRVWEEADGSRSQSPRATRLREDEVIRHVIEARDIEFQCCDGFKTGYLMPADSEI